MQAPLQMPPTQLAAMTCAAIPGQMFPQPGAVWSTPPPAPQLFTSVSVLVSQPSEFAPLLPTLSLQLEKPALHAILQLPAGHDGVPFCVEQTLPQPAAAPWPMFVLPPGPQLLTSKVVCSQPSL